MGKAKGRFEFQSSAELAREFPDVAFISCDVAEDVEHYLPTTHWIDSLRCLVQRALPSELVIIVGHRETIRGIAGEHMNTPYCAIALFDRVRCQAVAMTMAPGQGDREEDERRSEHQGRISGKPPRGAEAKKSSSKQREGPLYSLQQLYDPQGRSIMKS